MKTYNIEGCETDRRFVTKDWTVVATVRGANKADAMKTFNAVLGGKDADSELCLSINPNAGLYRSYRAVVA